MPELLVALSLLVLTLVIVRLRSSVLKFIAHMESVGASERERLARVEGWMGRKITAERKADPERGTNEPV